MAFPQLAGTNNVATALTSAAMNSGGLNLPASIVAGDLLIAMMVRGGAASQTITWPAGWTSIASNVQINGINRTAHVAYKYITAGAAEIGASTMSASSTVTTSERTVCIVDRWTGAHSSQAPEYADNAPGNGTNPNPPNLAASWGSADNSFVALGMCGDANRTVTTYPTSYGLNNAIVRDGVSTGQPSIARATREFASGSDNPVAYVMSGNLDNIGSTIVVRPQVIAVTLVAAVGAFALTGIAALKKISKIASLGTFALTGIAALSKTTRTLVAAVGTFALTGIAVAFHLGKTLTAAAGAFAVTGIAAILRSTRRMVAAVGTFTFTGIAAILNRGKVLAAAAGAFVFTGLATLKKISKVAAKGTFTLSGQIAVLRAVRRMVAAAGTFVFTGIAVTFRSGRRLIASVGTFVFTGKNAALGRQLVGVVVATARRVTEATLATIRTSAPSLSLRRAAAPALKKLRSVAPSLFK